VQGLVFSVGQNRVSGLIALYRIAVVLEVLAKVIGLENFSVARVQIRIFLRL
jgi:uncharacterized membrane protein (Fun14 family)